LGNLRSISATGTMFGECGIVERKAEISREGGGTSKTLSRESGPEKLINEKSIAGTHGGI
jgi:hypothetical protein